MDWLLGQFSKDPGRACAAYRRFVAEGMQHPSIWEALRDQIYLGSEAFIEKVKREVDAGGLSEVPRVQRRPSPLPLWKYEQSGTDRKEAMALAYRSGDYTMKSIADHFRVHYSTVSRAVKTYEEQQKQELA